VINKTIYFLGKVTGVSIFQTICRDLTWTQSEMFSKEHQPASYHSAFKTGFLPMIIYLRLQ